MNKVFRVVYNVARGKMMVVNEMTSSVQKGKKAAVTIAVLGALLGTSAWAAEVINDATSFIVESDDATIIYSNGTVHSNSLYSAGFRFESIPENKNISITNSSNYLSIGEDLGNGQWGAVQIETTGDITLEPGSEITHFQTGDVLRGRNITLGTLNNVNPQGVTRLSGGVIDAEETLTYTANVKLSGATVNANKLMAEVNALFAGDSVVTINEIEVINSLDLRDQALIDTNNLKLGQTMSVLDDAGFAGPISNVTFMSKTDTQNAPRIQLMGTQPIQIETLTVEPTIVGGRPLEAMLTDKMTTTVEGVTSFTIGQIQVQPQAILSVYADSKIAQAGETAIAFDEVTIGEQGTLNLGFRTSDFSDELGKKTIGTLTLAEGATMVAKSGANPDGNTALTDNAPVTLKNVNLVGSNAKVLATVTGDATNISLAQGVQGAEVAAVQSSLLTVAVVDASTSSMTIGEVAPTTTVGITTSSDKNTGQAQSDLQTLADAVAIGNTNGADVEVAIGETDVFGAMSAKVDANGQVIGVKEAANTKTEAVAKTMTLMPRIMTDMLTNDLRERMGDIRSSEATSGAWVRFNGGQLKGQGLDTDVRMVQVGVDTIPQVGTPRFGVAFSFAQSDTTAKVKSEADQYDLAAYGIWLGDRGEFVDVIAKMASIKTDLTSPMGQKSDLDNIALSLSGEFGWRFDMTKSFYVEPSVQATYTYINSEKFTLGNVNYNMESVDSLVGRAGLAAGFKCPANMGDLYVRVDVAHEFLGDATLNVNNGVRSYKQKGEDTWVEYALGTNINLNKSAYVYADVERTEGAMIDADWRANVGVRFAF